MAPSTRSKQPRHTIVFTGTGLAEIQVSLHHLFTG